MHPPDPSHDDPQDFSDLERQLTRLVPAAPGAAARRRMERQLEALATRRRDARKMWWRFAPVAAAAAVTLAGIALVRHQITGAQPETVAASPAGSETAAEARFVPPPPIVTGIPAEHFVPVSSQEFLRQTREGGVVELPDRVRAREIRVEYDDAWHWHDPATQTNVRIFRPREEIFLVPIETD